jgi:poly(A) polymerase
VPEAGEVEEVFTVPLHHHVLTRPLCHRRPAGWAFARRYYTVPYGPYYIWGATARILRGLAEGGWRHEDHWRLADHPGTQALCAALERAGHRALFVGGCVRNACWANRSADIDIATDALPKQSLTLPETAGFKVVPTGIDHGTVTVVAKGEPHEVTTFRRDVETDGRRAVVAFSRPDRGGRRAPRFHDERALRRPAGQGDRPAWRPARPAGPPRPLCRRCRNPHPRGLPAHPALLPFSTPPMATPIRAVDPDGLAACAAAFSGVRDDFGERITAELRKLLAAARPRPCRRRHGAVRRPGAHPARCRPRALAPLVHLDPAAAGFAALRSLGVLIRPTPPAVQSRSPRPDRSPRRCRQRRNCAALGWRLGRQLAGTPSLPARRLEQPLAQLPRKTEIARGASARFPGHRSRPDADPARTRALGARLKQLEPHGCWLALNLTLGRDELLKGA